MAWTLSIDGVDKSAGVRPISEFKLSGRMGSKTLAFRYQDLTGAYDPPEGAVVHVEQDGNVVFDGRAKIIDKTDWGIAGIRILDFSCVDNNVLLDMDAITDPASRSVDESDKDRISWLVSTFGTHGIVATTEVATLVAHLPAGTDSTPREDLGWQSLGKAILKVAEFAGAGGKVYVDDAKHLHYFDPVVGEGISAPFNVSDAPNNTTTFRFDNFKHTEDVVDKVHRITVKYPDPTSDTGYSTVTADSADIPGDVNKIVAAVVEMNDISSADQANAAAAGFLAARTTSIQGSFDCFRAGLAAGQSIQITHALYGLSAAEYQIVSVDARLESTEFIRYTVNYGVNPPDIATTIIGTAAAVGDIHSELTGIVTDTTLEGIPPAAPQNLRISSEVAQNSDGASFVRLVIILDQPPDVDLYGSYVQVTSENDGAGNPIWDHPTVIFIAAGNFQGQIENVAGNTEYWARAYAADQSGNVSGFTSTVNMTTVKDATAPDIPDGVAVVPGFHGFAGSWNPSSMPDLSYYEMRWAVDDGTGTGPDTSAWVTARTKSSVVFIGDLPAADNAAQAANGYWFEVRAVDLSGNVVTSATDSTAVDAVANPDDGYSDPIAVIPSLIGSSDIAANSVTAAMIQAGAISADMVTSGTLRINTNIGLATGISVFNNSGVLIGKWDQNGLALYDPTNTARYMLLDSGNLKFTTDNGATFVTAISPDGFSGTAVTLGALPGGHNVILNSSFELADFLAAPTVSTFTDATASPGWKAANRLNAPTDITEGTELVMSQLAF